MKILLSARRFEPPFVGGVDVFADRLARALQRSGHEVSVLAYDSDAESQNGAINLTSEIYNQTQIWRFHFDFAQRPKAAFDHAYDPEMGRVVQELLAEQKPDLFIILNFYMVTLAAVEAAKGLEIPVFHVATDFLPICRRATFIRWNGRSCAVGESAKSCSECFVSKRVPGRIAATVLNQFQEESLINLAKTYKPPHPFWILKPYWKQVDIMDRRLKIIQPLRKQIDLVLAPTRYLREKFLENGFSPNQVHFLPYGVEDDHPLASVKHIPSPNRRFLFIGRLQPYKGAHILIEAFNNLESPNGATLTIYGSADSGYEEYFNHLKEMMATNERISFGGQMAQSELSSIFSQADYFVLPSTWHENCPLVLLEALQSKTPVISSDIGGATDFVQDNINGLLFPMGKAADLQQVMQQAIDQPNLLEKFRASIELVTINDYIEKMFQLYGAKK